MEPDGIGPVMDLMIPASMAVGVSVAAWLVLPSLLRKCNDCVEAGPKSRLLGNHHTEKVPYHMSVFGALEDPARLLSTVVTFSYLGYFVAPKSLGAQYLSQIQNGTTVLSFIWFLYLWKRNVFLRVVQQKNLPHMDKDRYLTMDKLSSIGLLLLGGMALSEACGVAVQSVMTVGGIGGVATAFAARDLLGNILSGVALQFSRPFSIGDYITAGDLSGRVVDIGLHSTQMLNNDKFPTVVPNSFFSSQVIVNKSRVQWRGLDLNLPVKLTALEKLPTITYEIRSMLQSQPKVYLDDEQPRCHLSQVGPASFNLAITCNLKPMSMDEFLIAEEEILMEASGIVTRSDSKSELQLSDGAEIVEKPVVLSSSSESDDQSGNTESMVLSIEPSILPSPSVLGGEPSANKDSLAEPVARPVASSNSPPLSPSISPRVSNQSRSNSPRKHSANILGVGSKLLSRIKYPKGKHSDSEHSKS